MQIRREIPEKQSDQRSVFVFLVKGLVVCVGDVRVFPRKSGRRAEEKMEGRKDKVKGEKEKRRGGDMLEEVKQLKTNHFFLSFYL